MEGVSNAILLTEDPKLAAKYKQKSLAEQKSVDIAFNLLMQPEYENVRHYIYTNEKQLMQFRQVRKLDYAVSSFLSVCMICASSICGRLPLFSQLIVNSVIATDIFDREHSQFRKARWAKAFSEDSEPLSGNTTCTTSLDRKATIVIEHLIQASDGKQTISRR